MYGTSDDARDASRRLRSRFLIAYSESNLRPVILCSCVAFVLMGLKGPLVLDLLPQGHANASVVLCFFVRCLVRLYCKL